MAIEQVDSISGTGAGDQTSFASSINSQALSAAPSLADQRLFEEKLARERSNATAANPALQRYAFDTSGQNHILTDAKPVDAAPKPQAAQKPGQAQPRTPEWTAPPQEPGFSFTPALKMGGRIAGAIGAYFSDIPGLNGVKEGKLAGDVRYKYDGRTGGLSVKSSADGLNLYMKAGQDGVFRTPDGESAARLNPQTHGLEFDAGFMNKAAMPEGRAALQQQQDRLSEKTDSDKEPKTASGQNGQGFAVETHNQEEADLVASMKAEGKSANEIQTQLDDLRARRVGDFRQASQVKPNDPFATNTSPTGAVGGKPFGEAETIRPKTTEPEDKRGVRAQNDALSQLAAAGYRVTQQPTETKGPDGAPVLTSDMQKQLGLNPVKKPDALIEGRVFDVYSPATDNAKAIHDEISGKVGRGQAHRIVLNLRDSDASLRDLRQHLQENPIVNLKEILLLDKNGKISHFFPFKG